MSVLQPVIWTFGLAAVLRNFLGFQNFMTMVADATLTHNVLDVDCRSNLHPKAKLRKISIRGNKIRDFFCARQMFFSWRAGTACFCINSPRGSSHSLSPANIWKISETINLLGDFWFPDRQKSAYEVCTYLRLRWQPIMYLQELYDLKRFDRFCAQRFPLPLVSPKSIQICSNLSTSSIDADNLWVWSFRRGPQDCPHRQYFFG